MHANGFLTIFKNADICVIPGKLAEIHLHEWLFSNPQGKVLTNVEISCSPDLRVQPIYYFHHYNFFFIKCWAGGLENM